MKIEGPFEQGTDEIKKRMGHLLYSQRADIFNGVTGTDKAWFDDEHAQELGALKSQYPWLIEDAEKFADIESYYADTMDPEKRESFEEELRIDTELQREADLHYMEILIININLSFTIKDNIQEITYFTERLAPLIGKYPEEARKLMDDIYHDKGRMISEAAQFDKISPEIARKVFLEEKEFNQGRALIMAKSILVWGLEPANAAYLLQAFYESPHKDSFLNLFCTAYYQLKKEGLLDIAMSSLVDESRFVLGNFAYLEDAFMKILDTYIDGMDPEEN